MGETFHWNHHHQKEDSSPVSEVPRGTRVSICSLSSSLPASVIPCSPSGSCSLAAGVGTQPVECLPGIHGVWCSAPHGISVVATACSANPGKVEARESDIQGHDWLYIASSKLPWTMWVWPLQKEGEEERREKGEETDRQTLTSRFIFHREGLTYKLSPTWRSTHSITCVQGTLRVQEAGQPPLKIS